MNELKFDLGGKGYGKNGYRTVNLVGNCDIQKDITDLDSFCEDNTVDEFFLSHTLEHIAITKYNSFLLNMRKKLKVGGSIRILQSDAGKVIEMWINSELSFRAMRCVIFPPANRAEINLLLQHQNMWSQEELIKDFETIGMRAKPFDAGFWKYDVDDDIIPTDTKKYFGIKIPNLGVIAEKVL